MVKREEAAFRGGRSAGSHEEGFGLESRYQKKVSVVPLGHRKYCERQMMRGPLNFLIKKNQQSDVLLLY